MKELERRLLKLEGSLGSSTESKTLEEMFEALQRGHYGGSNLMSLVVSILSHGWNVDHLRDGEIPELLLNALVEHLRSSVDGAEDKGPDNL
jgi:hypothetical protein